LKLVRKILYGNVPKFCMMIGLILKHVNVNNNNHILEYIQNLYNARNV
jgi:hypothetical protein